MEHLDKFNEHISKSDKRDPNNRVKQLCSYAIFEIKYKSGIFKREKKINLKIWFTPTKIVVIEPDTKDLSIDVPFNVGDHFDDVYNWANENNYDLLYLKRKGNRNMKA